MAAETALLVTLATSLASGALKGLGSKAATAAMESSPVVGLSSVISGSLEADLRCLEKELMKLNAVLSCAQSIDPTHYDKNDLLLIWLKDVKEIAFDAENILDKIAYEKIRRKLSKEASLMAEFLPSSGSDTSLSFRIRIAKKIQKCLSRITEVHAEAGTTLNLVNLAGKAAASSSANTVSEDLREVRASPDMSIVVGREADEEFIVNQLCSNTHNSTDLPVIAITGISGVGKTTLARMIYDNKTIEEHFGKRLWIFVSDNFRLQRFLDVMLQTITGESHGLTDFNAMEEKLKMCLQDEKKEYLVVLDDVWNTNDQLWKSLKSLLARVACSTRCRILVTTQSDDVARLMCASPVHKLTDLYDTDAWALFERLAFVNKNQELVSELEDVGRRILRKCNGLPLAIQTMGSMLGSMNEKSEWERVERSEMWGQSKIMPWLLISFHHLHDVAIKQCFVHCSIVIEKGQAIQQSDLIQAWMAQGFIQSTSESGQKMEDIGETYVNILLSNGLLQEFKMSAFRCLKMHDLIHDLTRNISRDATCILRESREFDIAVEAEHVRICNEDNLVAVYNLPKDKSLSKLRTLICTRATLSIKFEAQAKFLRDLRLMDCELYEVPSSIGKLKHLRYLSLRCNPFSNLPDSLGTLYNLRTLDVRECYNLRTASDELKNLVNLRDALTSDTIMFAAEKGFEITQLEYMDILGGTVEMSDLHLINAKEIGVEVRSLKAQARIKELVLKWGISEQQTADGDGNDTRNDEVVMDGFHPHSNLEWITVDGFRGKRLSSWLHNMNNLRSIVLKSCTRCERLPALGQLAYLLDLQIEGLENVEVIGDEFYHNDEGKASTSSDMSRCKTLFPQLGSLSLKNMQKLRDWVEPLGEYKELFPALQYLHIIYCPMLSSAPTCFESLDGVEIANIKSEEVVRMILTNNKSARLDISCMGDLTFLSTLGLKTSLLVRGNINSRLVPDLRSLNKLRRLTLVNFPDQMSIPEWLSCLRELRDLEIGGFNEELVELDGAAYIPKGIESLTLLGWPKLKSLPSEIQTLNQLSSLTIREFEGIERLPEWLGNLSSLQRIYIEDCKNLKHLQSLEAIRRPTTNLESFTIRGCPILQEKFTRSRYCFIGEDFVKYYVGHFFRMNRQGIFKIL